MLLLLLHLRGGGIRAAVGAPVAGAGGRVKAGDIVLVTAYDPIGDKGLWEGVQRNREDYARKHGN